MKLNKILLLIPLVIAIYLVIKLASSSPEQNSKSSPIRIAIPKLYSSALIIIANEKGFFKKNKLAVTLDSFKYGKSCIQKMHSNNYDLSVSYLTPIAASINKGEKFTLLTEIHSSSHNTTLLYRKDLIENVKKDFKKFPIGFIKGTNAEFLIHLFAGVNFINEKELKLTPSIEDELKQMLLDGKIGSAVFWQPNADQILFENSSILTKAETTFYKDFSILIGRTDFINNNRLQVESFIKSLIEAQSFLKDHPKEAKKIVLKYLDQSDSPNLTKTLSKIETELKLSRVFAVALSSELQWKSNSKFKFLKKLKEEKYIRSEFLMKFLPEKVMYR